MQVGFSSQIITPDLINRKRPLQLAGYSPRKYCSGVHDELYARAVYLEGVEDDITTHVLMIVCDIVSINSKFANLVKEYISRSIPISPENILISATHTHHGPDYSGVFRNVGYLGMFVGIISPKPQSEDLIFLGIQIYKAAKNAYKNRIKAKIGANQIEIPQKDRIIINRREIFNYDKAKYPITVLKVENGNGELHGLILNYACHGTVLPYQNTLITADYIGYIVKALEREYPEIKGNMVYFNGPCGEINPLSLKLKTKMEQLGPSGVKNSDIYQQKGTFEDAEHIGGIIANYALNTVDTIICEDPKQIAVIQDLIKIPIKDYDYGSDLKSALRRFLYRRKLKLFAKLKKWGIIRSSVFFNVDNVDIKMGGHVSSTIQLINIGNVIITTTPGEFFLELGNEVNKYAMSIFPSKIPFMIELANDSIGYLSTIEAYMKGGYESAFSIIPLGGRFIAMKLKQMIKKLDIKE